jgi:GT2 family glycosyltransferase/glycosyltransferase involved in cell wall biosynthesis
MRILLVVHGFPPAASGGTEVYVRDLAAALAASGGDDVKVLTRENDAHRPELSLRMSADGPVGVTTINNTFQSCESFEESYANPAIERIAGDVLDDWQPDVVHLQHFTCLSTGIPRQAALRGIPVVVTLNDYWLICHRGQLVDLNGRRCAGPFEGGCARCLPPGVLASAAAFRAGRLLRSVPVPGAPQAVKLAARAIGTMTPSDRTRAATAARLRHMQAAVGDVDLFLAPSATLAETFIPFGIPADRFARCNQGIPLAPFEGGRRIESVPLRVGFAGGLLPTKGPHVLLDAIEQMPSGSVVVDLLGSSGAYHGQDAYAESLATRLGHPAIRRLGPVPHERMPAVFQDLDVLVVPSTWIENAPFIIREAFAAGVPVVASDLGGMAEMVRDGIDGLLFQAGNARALAAALRRLVDDRSLLEALRAGIVRPMSIEEDAASLRAVYAQLTGTRRRQGPTERLRSEATSACAASTIAAVVLNHRTAEQTWLAVRSLQTSRTRPFEILVVDNASGDGSADRLRGSLERVRVLESPTNAGFPGGCNIGIRGALAAGAEYILLLNSDAVLAPDAIGHMAAAMAAHPGLGIVAPVLLSREEPDHVSSAGISFSRRTARMRHRAAGRRVAALEPGPVHIVDAVSGCVMLIRRAVFERAGLLDEAYFFSFEDIDFCLRARDAGYQTGCVQDALAYHEGGRTIGRRSARRVYFATRNHLRLATQAGRPADRSLRAGMVVGLNAAYLLVSPEAPLIRGASALVRGAWHHFTGRYGRD